MQILDHGQLLGILEEVRRQLSEAFSADTAATGFPATTPSAGHCAAVSSILSSVLGAEMASARVNGLSHWFNRLHLSSGDVDFDLTGDQFGYSPVQIASAGTLYPETRIRPFSDLNEETRTRAALLAGRAKLLLKANLE
jgi:hypothetical protein